MKEFLGGGNYVKSSMAPLASRLQENYKSFRETEFIPLHCLFG